MLLVLMKKEVMHAEDTINSNKYSNYILFLISGIL